MADNKCRDDQRQETGSVVVVGDDGNQGADLWPTLAEAVWQQPPQTRLSVSTGHGAAASTQPQGLLRPKCAAAAATSFRVPMPYNPAPVRVPPPRNNPSGYAFQPFPNPEAYIPGRMQPVSGIDAGVGQRPLLGRPPAFYGHHVAPVPYPHVRPGYIWRPHPPPPPFRYPMNPGPQPPQFRYPIRPGIVPFMQPPRPDILALKAANIVTQIEYYFSDENLQNDYFLKKLMDGEGWVPISKIAEFRRIKSMTTDIGFIVYALRTSNVLEVQGDNVRQRLGWYKWVKS